MASVSPLTLHAGQAELASGNSSSDQSQDSAGADAAADKAEKSAVSPTLHLRGCVKKKWSPASGDIVGSKKLATPLSAFSIELDSGSVDGSVVYRSRQVKKKYQHWRQNGAVSGKASKKGSLDAVAIKMTGAIAQDYDVMYRVRAKGSGWRPWTSGGLTASAGRGEPIVAMQVRLVERPEKTPVERTVEDGLYVVSPVVAKKLAVAPKATASVAPPPVLAASDSSQLAGKLKIT